MPNKLIGRVVATEKTPTTMDKFTFWTNSDLKLQAFDIVKVKHIDNSYSYGVIQNISRMRKVSLQVLFQAISEMLLLTNQLCALE